MPPDRAIRTPGTLSSFHPAPIPRVTRPPERACAVATVLARCAGLRKLLERTSWPQSVLHLIRQPERVERAERLVEIRKRLFDEPRPDVQADVQADRDSHPSPGCALLRGACPRRASTPERSARTSHRGPSPRRRTPGGPRRCRGA